MTFVRLIKLSESEKPYKPNHKPVGYDKFGVFMEAPVAGKAFYLSYSFRTSVVEEVLFDNTFRTLNSIYQYTVLPDNFESCFVEAQGEIELRAIVKSNQHPGVFRVREIKGTVATITNTEFAEFKDIAAHNVDLNDLTLVEYAGSI